MSEAELRAEETTTYVRIIKLQLALLAVLGGSFFNGFLGLLYWPALTALGVYAASERDRIARLKEECLNALAEASAGCPLGLDEVSCFGVSCPNRKTCMVAKYSIGQ